MDKLVHLFVIYVLKLMIKTKHLLHERINHLTWLFDLELILIVTCSSSKAVEVLEAYEGTLEDDYPPENERYEHNEMLLYKVCVS
jgi:N-alpha-acetyltransferase 15/16, NatA auxiliary subunit